MHKIELLSPAGSLNKIKVALDYGADAVYFGGRNYSLRANAKNLDIDEIKEACAYAHKKNKKVYVTVNIIFHNKDTEGLVDYLHKLENAKVDAIIVADPLVIKIVKENNIKIPIHISTQTSTANYESVLFWKDLGVERVVLARETSRDEIKEIIDKTGMEIECFIHGAMCSSYSGRCVLSNYFTKRDANRGGCAQICRWNFTLCDKNKNEIESKTKFTMSCKDLSMVHNIKDMINIGITSFKIEGRMRSIYYVATVVNAYRHLIDDILNNTLTKEKEEKYIRVLDRVANRDSISQFYNKFPDKNEQYYTERQEDSNQDFLGLVNSYEEGYAIISVKNYFKKGDSVEFMSPYYNEYSTTIKEIIDEEGNLRNIANHPEEILKIKVDREVYPGDMIHVKVR